ncbi:glucose-1-phosphate cytidylyltransferase [Algisphaera agarilytica]|uniref:Glucose-1-phosphate cytidylyltransferase n=1 Tax=Algisphaera agarilytica TaxID=1385975 RepID=A0A7X0LKN4_9BACT|nr:glucose-1-phosphate cytidylyltransferase [Algisphaera agarilytica]MBB6430019.1 glucose-1-phosphate cytidylyltransferase [Algisphaera agarilytica]
MDVVLLAGGLGTRLSEQTEVRPKPMVEIGGRPILWHIMKLYAQHDFKDFWIALGYKGSMIKQYFLNYYQLGGDLSIDLKDGNVEIARPQTEDWRVHLIDTGLHTNTGGRLEKLFDRMPGDTFMLTYGDGVANVDLTALLDFHKNNDALVTLTAVRPTARFGSLDFDGDLITRFSEKSQVREGWINGGYMVMDRGVSEYFNGPDTNLEKGILEKLAADGKLAVFKHDGFWQCMDTQREVSLLNEMWLEGDPPWKVWHD